LTDRNLKLEQLLDSSGPRLLGLLLRVTLRQHVAEDLLQDLFVRLAGSDAFFSSANPHAYAYTTAIRLAFDWRRSRARHRLDSLQDEPADKQMSPLHRLLHDERMATVLDAMSLLTESDREILVLRHLQQESYEAIAQKWSTTSHRARAICHKAMTRLRKHLETELLSPELLSKELLSKELLSKELLSTELLSTELLSKELLSPELLSKELLSKEEPRADA
jgi:RNA polymerase sigma factor (sigma-70 family)